VSLALALAGKLEDGMKQCVAYSFIQIIGGCTGSLAYSMLFQDSFNIGPTKGYLWWQAMVCEVIYTFIVSSYVSLCSTQQHPKQNVGQTSSMGLPSGG